MVLKSTLVLRFLPISSDPFLIYSEPSFRLRDEFNRLYGSKAREETVAKLHEL